MTSSDQILALIRTALDEFDDRPLPVSVRRAIRIASLIGDSRAAARLGYELKDYGSAGSSPEGNKADTQRLTGNASTWGEPDDPALLAMDEYLRERKLDDGRIVGHSLVTIDFLEQNSFDENGPFDLPGTHRMRQVRELARHRTFTYLCSWERQFGYSSINEFIFGGYRERVDRLLSTSAPALIEQFNAVYRRLSEAAASGADEPASEELSQAITSCRRILEAVVNYVFPPQKEPADSGHKLDAASYKNRLFEFIKRSSTSRSAGTMTQTLTAGLYERFDAVNTLTNQGVHAAMALEIGNLCALNTYVLCGEILRLQLPETER